MIHYKDKTFCTFYETCLKQHDCHRPLTPAVKAAAANWWGSDDAPIAMFGEKPECHTNNASSAGTDAKGNL
jgi:hypothetical protein